MSNFSGYKTKQFSETQKFFVLDPNTGSPSFVQGSDLVKQLTPNSNYIYSEATRTTAQATDYPVGSLIETAGDTSAGDNFAAGYLVVEGGQGDFPMQNGNDLLVIKGDELLREQLASDSASDGSDLVAHTGTTDTVTEALNKRTIYVGSVAELEALSLPAGTNVYLTEEGRAGEFVVKSGTPPSDPQKGIYIVLANGNYAERVVSGLASVKWWGAVGDGVTNDYTALAAAADSGAKGLIFDAGNYFIGGNELVFSQASLRIVCVGNVEIQGTGDYVVTFASEGGTGQPASGHPTSQRVYGLTARTVSPFGAISNRAAMRISASYGIYDVGVITSADDAGNGILLEADDTGTGPYYNKIHLRNVQGPQNGAATGIGFNIGQRAGTAIATRFANTNEVSGRVAGYLVNWQMRGQGNMLIKPVSENAPFYGTAFKWDRTVANSNVENSVISPYVENADTAFEVDAGVIAPSISGQTAITGTTTELTDPDGVLASYADLGKRSAILPKGLSVGNTNNADSETLDWYEEGAWTPGVEGGTTAGSYSVTPDGASYTRIGNTVYAEARFSVTENSPGSGSARFTGLPYPKGSNKWIGGSVNTTNVSYTAGVGVAPGTWTGGVDSSFTIQSIQSSGAPVTVTVSDLLAGNQITVSLVYKV